MSSPPRAADATTRECVGGAPQEGAIGGRDELRRWLRGLAEDPLVNGEPVPGELAREARDALRGAPAPGHEPGVLLAQHCGVSPGEWHAAHLEASLREARRAGDRVRYHARWLCWLLDPEEAAQGPLVTVMIPVRDAAPLVGEAISSALAQTWPRVEVLVVDDGSRDDLAGALAPFSGHRPLRLVRQERLGLAAAREHGFREARGELVHFLDADDLLDPDAIERKLWALARAPHADLCCSRYRVRGHNGRRGEGDHQAPDFGDAFCPTRGLLACAVRRYPFHTSSLMIARWLALELGAWERDFTGGSDTRFFFRLALRGAQVAALRDELGTRRFWPGSVTAREGDFRLLRPGVHLMNTVDLLRSPEHWRELGPQLARLRMAPRWREIQSSQDPALALWRARFLAALEELGAGRARGGLSPEPVLRLVDHILIRRNKALDAGSDLARELGLVVARGLRRAPQPGRDDIRFWLADPRAVTARHNAPALRHLASRAARRLRRGGLAADPAQLLTLSSVAATSADAALLARSRHQRGLGLRLAGLRGGAQALAARSRRALRVRTRLASRALRTR